MWSVWLVFCDCGFHSVCPLIVRIRGLWNLPDQRDWLRGKLGLVLMGGAMLSKSLIQFSVVGGAVFPPCCLTWGQTMVEVVKVMVTSFKRSHTCRQGPGREKKKKYWQKQKQKHAFRDTLSTKTLFSELSNMILFHQNSHGAIVVFQSSSKYHLKEESFKFTHFAFVYLVLISF